MHDADLAVSIGIHFRIQDNQNHHFVSLLFSLSICSILIPDNFDCVPVKYFSMTLFDKPTASNICAP